MIELNAVVDSLFTILACTSAGFLVYGGWLCLPVSRLVGPQGDKMLPKGSAYSR